jgi:hypothetical protein
VVLLLALALVAGVIPVIVVVLIGGVKLLPLGAVDNEVGGVAALKAALGVSSSPCGTGAKLRTFLPVGRSHRQGCSHAAHQKLQTKKTK